jgi:uncharacterized membrane protein
VAHYTNTRAHGGGGIETLGTLVALAPILAGALSLAWHSRLRAPMLAALAIACVAMAAQWQVLTQHYSRIYWLEHASTQTLLALMFARTLRAGREPLCTHFARLIHGALPPAIERYTRQVTVAWVIFFATMAAASTGLYLAAPLEAWSIFANFLTAPLIASMFLFEYLARRFLHPDFKHAHILDAAKAFWNAPAR